MDVILELAPLPFQGANTIVLTSKPFELGFRRRAGCKACDFERGSRKTHICVDLAWSCTRLSPNSQAFWIKEEVKILVGTARAGFMSANPSSHQGFALQRVPQLV